MLLSALIKDFGVVNALVWHRLQPRALNCARPFVVDEVRGCGVGGARKRMKSEKRSRSPGKLTGSFGASPVSERSSGTPLVLLVPGGTGNGGRQLAIDSSFSLGNASSLLPTSTVYASPEKYSNDLFCAFQPKREI